LDLEHADNKKEYDLVIWYLEKYLPCCAGQKWYGKSLRLKHFPAEKVAIAGSEPKVLVPISTEAVGILALENCYTRWVKTAEWRKDDPKRAIPKTGPDAAQFSAKWSDSSVGQVKFGGWNPACYPVYQKYVGEVQKARKADEANNWARQRYGLQLLQKKHKVGPFSGATANNTKKGRKRKAPEPPAENQLTRLEE
jgi:hypothetical protein